MFMCIYMVAPPPGTYKMPVFFGKAAERFFAKRHKQRLGRMHSNVVGLFVLLALLTQCWLCVCVLCFCVIFDLDHPKPKKTR